MSHLLSLPSFDLLPSNDPQVSTLVEEILRMGAVQTGHLKNLNIGGIELGKKLAELEEKVGSEPFLKFLKGCYPQAIVRYFRNLTAQAKLLVKFPEFEEQVLNLAPCHAALLIAGSEKQVEEVLKCKTKWTVSLIKEKLTAPAIEPSPLTELAVDSPVAYLGEIGTLVEVCKDFVTVRSFSTGEQHQVQPGEVRPLECHSFEELKYLLATIGLVNRQLKEAVLGERDKSDLTFKLGLLAKCKKSLQVRLNLDDNHLTSLKEVLDPSLAEADADAETCDRAFAVYGVSDKDAVLVRAKLLARLRLKDPSVEPVPTIAELVISIASSLHKTRQGTGGGISITSREIAEFNESLKQSHETVSKLKEELAEHHENARSIEQDLQEEIEILKQRLAEQSALIAKQRDRIQQLEQSASVQSAPSVQKPKSESNAQTEELSDAVDEALYHLARCLSGVGIPGWNTDGTHEKQADSTKVLLEAVSQIIELLQGRLTYETYES